MQYCNCIVAGLACALTGNYNCSTLFLGCVNNLPPEAPPAPPAPPSTDDDSSCPAPMVSRGPFQARMVRPALLPRDGGGGGSITFVDPVPDLQNGDGSDVTANKGLLGDSTLGTQVQAVAADSAARVVLRIPACSKGKQWTLSILN